MATKRQWTPLTEEEREARRNDASDRVKAEVSKILEGDEFKRYLLTAKRFHRYSFANVLLIVSQKPDATQVAGFNAWKALGRHVKKGETSLKVWVPLKGRKRDDEAASAESGDESGAEGGTRERRPMRFGLGPVFDISQTEGEPLPEPPRPRLLEGGDDVDIYFRLKACEAYAREIGFPIRYAEACGVGRYAEANGVADFEQEEIVIKSTNPKLQQLKTAVHELTHAVVHKPEVRQSGTDRTKAELEAEAAAFLVCDEWGLDSSDYSFPYLASWAETPEALIPAVERARKFAAAISAKLAEHMAANEEQYHTAGQELLVATGGAQVLAAADSAGPIERAPTPEPVIEGPADDDVAALLGIPALAASAPRRVTAAESVAATVATSPAPARVPSTPAPLPAGIPAGAINIFDL